MNPETTDEIHVEKWYVATKVPMVSAPNTQPPNAYVKICDDLNTVYNFTMKYFQFPYH
jgi:hypothetical protein